MVMMIIISNRGLNSSANQLTVMTQVSEHERLWRVHSARKKQQNDP